MRIGGGVPPALRRFTLSLPGGLCLESRSGAEILDVVTAACGASSNQRLGLSRDSGENRRFREVLPVGREPVHDHHHHHGRVDRRGLSVGCLRAFTTHPEDGVWGRPTSSSSGLWQHREGHCVSSQRLGRDDGMAMATL